jgi:hypothetical protein
MHLRDLENKLVTTIHTSKAIRYELAEDHDNNVEDESEDLVSPAFAYPALRTARTWVDALEIGSLCIQAEKPAFKLAAKMHKRKLIGLTGPGFSEVETELRRCIPLCRHFSSTCLPNVEARWSLRQELL